MKDKKIFMIAKKSPVTDRTLITKFILTLTLQIFPVSSAEIIIHPG